MTHGAFIISLDFELYWGVRDTRDLETYGRNILGVRQAIPAMLDLFDRYGIKATFATVGFLFCSGKDELMKSLPNSFPTYRNAALSPYNGYFDNLGSSEMADPYHFGNSLIRMIMKRKQHEIATHTHSHYYCLEEGQTAEQFRDDLRASKKIAETMGVEFNSIVFPRNQYDGDYLDSCKREGITAFRGNEQSWLYEPRNRGSESMLRRAFRLLDSYINITGFHTYSPTVVNGLCNIPSSRFLRPYSNKIAVLEPLRLFRIKKQMTVAAKRKQIFHLWWHPHNFGINLEENLSFLEKILQHYKVLHQSQNFTSMTMNEVASDFNS